LAATTEHVGAKSAVTQRQSCAQNPESAQKPAAHAVARPSQSESPKHEIPEGITIVVEVLELVLDVVAIVVEDVVDAWVGCTRVGRGAPVVVDPPVVVVVTAMHPLARVIARQRSTSVAGAAPADTATRSRRVLPAGTVSV
jgi:hypothetical protein